MPDTPRTVQLLEDVEEHIDATVALRDEIIAAAADQTFTSDEIERILVGVTRVAETAEDVAEHADHLDAARRMIQIVNQTGSLTDKGTRTLRELRTGLIWMEEERAKRRGLPLEAA